MGELSSPARLGIHQVSILSNWRGGSGYDRLIELFRLTIGICNAAAQRRETILIFRIPEFERGTNAE